MGSDGVPGLYDAVFTRRLARDLIGLDPELAGLDDADQPHRFAQHVGDVLAAHLSEVDEAERAARRRARGCARSGGRRGRGTSSLARRNSDDRRAWAAPACGATRDSPLDPRPPGQRSRRAASRRGI